MEETLETGEDKIQQICDALRKETLEPAKKEAESLVAEGKRIAEQIIHEAEVQAKQLLQRARETVQQEKNVFRSSLEQAGKQALQALKQAVEEQLFRQVLQQVVRKGSSQPDMITKLITAMAHAVEHEGLSTSFTALIPQTVSVEEVNRLLGEKVLKMLEGKGVSLGEFAGGVQVKMLDKKITIDITDEALLELLSSYIRKDFRKLLFVD